MSAIFYVLLIGVVVGACVLFWHLFMQQKQRSIVIVLVGASSSGKTSLVREFINAQYPRRLFISTGIDQTFFALGSSTRIITKKNWVDGEVNFTYTNDIDGSPIVDLSMGSIGDKIQRINYDFALSAADSGLHVIVDEVALNDDTLEYLLNTASSRHDVYLVSVYAPLMIREERERSRIHRFAGHTRSQETRAYQYKGHNLFRENLCDLSLETQMYDPAECAKVLSSFIENNSPVAVERLKHLAPAANIEECLNYQEAQMVKKHPFVRNKKPIAYLLIGASSAGKTTLAKALVDSYYPGDKYLTAGIDDIFRALGDETVPLRRDYWVDGEINYQKSVDEHGKPTVAISLGDLGENLMCLAYDRAAAFLDAGFSVVIDDVILSDRVFEYALDKLKNYSVYLVGVYAPLEVREHREQVRGNRPVGHTRSQESRAYMFKGVNLLKKHLFDVVINTSVEDVVDAVPRLQAYVQQHSPHALQALQKKI